ncbi:hypothetical protein [Pseudomonas cyclaminis]|nr:hypothetical protein [Pseudomonas cyclaminis]
MPPTRVLIALLFTIQLVSMGAMEMSGPFFISLILSGKKNSW